ncbi:MAG: hypothetical protein K6F03_04740 [Saccharofermentans sp.]|nr:hypothetical protein [Saccharofermentans sp.]
MTYYYIDFENVKTAGLKGIDSLPSGDTVKIFAKGGSDQMKFNDIKTLMNAKPAVAIEDVVTGTKNALDFQLLADLTIDCTKRAGMTPAPKFVIISADHGYDPAITQIKKRGFNNVFRAVSIKDAENGNFCGEKQKQSKPQPKAAPKAGDEKVKSQPAQKDEEQPKAAPAQKPRRRTPSRKPDSAPAEKNGQKTEQKPEQKSEQKQQNAKPKTRRVHSRTINKAETIKTETQKN